MTMHIYLSIVQMPHNKRMQTDQNARYAFILTADAKRYVARATMNNITVLVLFLFTFSGCASVKQQRVNIESNIAEIYSSHYSEEIQQFFIEEAINAGVKTIRAMKPSEKRPSSNKNEIIGCAYADIRRKLILIEVNQPLCTKLSHLAHEIAHIGSNCGAHDNVFYKYNFAIAKRYETEFPDATTRKWFAPVQSVANVEAIYRNGNC